jgi:hypothetical protein
MSRLAGYDLTCNKILSITPKTITMGAPGVFKDAKRFMHIVSNERYLRVVSEGRHKDIIATISGALAYNQPSYPYLPINPNTEPGDEKKCMLGLCHVMEPNYMNRIVMGTAVFNDKCAELAGLEAVVSNTSCAPSAELNTSCTLASAMRVGAIAQNRFDIALGGLSVRTFGAARQEKLRGILVTLLRVDPTYIAFTVLRAQAGLGIVVATAVTTLENATADVRSTIEDPAFMYSVGSLVVGEGLVKQISQLSLGGIEAADGYRNASNLNLSLTADRAMDWSYLSKEDRHEPKGAIEKEIQSWGKYTMVAGSIIFSLVLIYVIASKKKEGKWGCGKRIHASEKGSMADIRDGFLRTSIASADVDGTLHINQDSLPRKQDGTRLKVVKKRVPFRTRWFRHSVAYSSTNVWKWRQQKTK